mgnify:CR=1 FL=1
MEISLDFITGKDKSGEDIVKTKLFVANKPKARLVRRAAEIEKQIDFTHFTPETLDIAVDFLCEIYNNKFTRDELYDGIESDKLFTTYTDTVNRVINGVISKLDTFPQK